MTTRSSETASSTVSSLSIVIPLFNSQATVGELVDRLIERLSGGRRELQIVLVNDGSSDGTDGVARAAVERHPGLVEYVELARNFGEHNAVMCGLVHSTGEAVVVMDDDFQNPPDEVDKLVRCLEDGYDVVYARYEEKKHHPLRNLGSRFNDYVATWMLRKPRDLYLSSFKAMRRRLVDQIVEYEGPYCYVDGLILRSTSSIGQQTVEHEERAEGQSNYTFRRLVRLWLNMFTSFSVVPLRAASILGAVMSVVGVLLAVFFVVSWYTGGLLIRHEDIPPGWASLIVSVTVFAGVQLLVLGILGEYVGRVFLTVNRTPQFVVRDVYRGG